MRLAANISMMYNEWAFLDRPAKARQDGFRFIECMFPYEHTLGEWVEHTERADIGFVLINASAGQWQKGERGLAVEPANRDRFRMSIEQALQYAKGLNVKQVHVLAGLAAQDKFGLAKDCYLSNLSWLCEQTINEGIFWNIEPINTRDVPDYFLTSQTQAHEIVKSINSPCLKVQMDLYHCQIMEGDVVTKLNEFLPTQRVGHIQIAGVPERHEPDMSELNYERIFSELTKLNYGGYIGCEYRPKRSTREGLGWLKKPLFSGTM